MIPLPARARRILAPLLFVLAFVPASVRAEVTAHFHSFNGSALIGRYPHTFVVFEGHLDDTDTPIHENWGFSARRVTPAILTGPVEHVVMVEEERQIARTNRHFSVTVSDSTYRRMRAEVEAWRNAPGRYYDLDTRNCIHFVGRLAQLSGLTVDYPQNLMRKPRAWLNHIAALNPQLSAAPI
ncbi:hypothetical protein [Croceibacterium ferulae]|uniref:hypothetical protein n=1 Tax=Croceibacterium ferulae TaxID=1854641 RepID=UPI000EADE481|nr:hypothetical protein [Croceibacterium ferulae]